MSRDTNLNTADSEVNTATATMPVVRLLVPFGDMTALVTPSMPGVDMMRACLMSHAPPQHRIVSESPCGGPLFSVQHAHCVGTQRTRRRERTTTCDTSHGHTQSSYQLSAAEVRASLPPSHSSRQAEAGGRRLWKIITIMISAPPRHASGCRKAQLAHAHQAQSPPIFMKNRVG